MSCARHPEKRAVASCGECCAEFCIECVRETDQTALCAECYQRKLGGTAGEFTGAGGAEDERPPDAVSGVTGREPAAGGREPLPQQPELPTAPAAPPEGKGAGRRWGRGRREKPAPESLDAPASDFLSQGPDEDFSRISQGTARGGRRPRGEMPASSAVADAPGPSPSDDGIPSTAGEDPPPGASVVSGDELLMDVMSALLKPEGDAPQGPVEDVSTEAQGMHAPRARAGTAAVRKGKGGRERAPSGRSERREERAARWAFLAQPRSSQYTLIAESWWRAAIFVALMLLLGAALWALPNAYLIPKDLEYGIHAVAVGIVLGLAFWWKAGKKHSTKLAVQASLTTLFALSLGEFLHWFLIVMKYDAFRTIFFDLVSFRFLWENGAEILRLTVEAMFPVAFLWILLLPTLTAFVIGFGMPPVPEIFFQIWRAFKGRAPEEKEASHGLEG